MVAGFLYNTIMKKHLCLSLVMFLSLSGCSLTVTEHDDCRSNRECQNIFGADSVCSEGFCETISLPPRCSQTEPEDLFSAPERYTGAIIIGCIYDWSLEKKEARRDAVRLGAIQVNQEGGIDGKLFGVVFCDIKQDNKYDTLDKEAAAIETSDFLVRTLGVPAIVGPSGSADTAAVFDSLRGSGALVISPSATSSSLTDLEGEPSDDNPGLLWRTAAPDSLQGSVIATDMMNREITKVAVIHETGAYGEGLATEFFEGFSESIDIVQFDSDTERATAITNVGEGDYDEVLFIGRVEDIVAFLDSAALLSGYSDPEQGIFLTDTASNNLFDDLSTDAKEMFLTRIRKTSPFEDKEATSYTFFQAAFMSHFGRNIDEFSYTSNSYDAAWLVFIGIAYSYLREGEITGPDIAKGLRHVSSGEEITIQASAWRTIREKTRNGQVFNLVGASGNLDYNSDTEETESPIALQIVNPETLDSFDVLYIANP